MSKNKKHPVKKRIPSFIAAIAVTAFSVCGFVLVPEIAELRVTEPFIELDVMVKDSPGASGAEEVKKEEADPAPVMAQGTDEKDTRPEIRVSVRGGMIKLDGIWCSGYNDFTEKFLKKYNSRNITVYLIDDYADSVLYNRILAYFRKYEITPVKEQVDN